MAFLAPSTFPRARPNNLTGTGTLSRGRILPVSLKRQRIDLIAIKKERKNCPIEKWTDISARDGTRTPILRDPSGARMSGAFFNSGWSRFGTIGLIHFTAGRHVVTDDASHPGSTVASGRTLQNVIGVIKSQSPHQSMKVSLSINDSYLSPSSCPPLGIDTWNVVRFRIPFIRIEAIECWIDMDFKWLRNETIGCWRKCASRRWSRRRRLLSRRLERWSSRRWIGRTRMFETLLDGRRPLLASAESWLDDTSVFHSTADDPLGLSDSARHRALNSDRKSRLKKRFVGWQKHSRERNGSRWRNDSQSKIHYSRSQSKVQALRLCLCVCVIAFIVDMR